MGRKFRGEIQRWTVGHFNKIIASIVFNGRLIVHDRIRGNESRALCQYTLKGVVIENTLIRHAQNTGTR